jgi:putative oxidoreductase
MLLRLSRAFPGASMGVGLLVLRLLLAVCLVADGGGRLVAGLNGATESGAAVTGTVGLVLVVCGAFAAVGFLTPIVQLAVVIIELGVLSGRLGTSALAGLVPNVWQARLVEALIGATLALTGPGAYSIDARRFGWREINIPPRLRRVE